MRTITFPTRPFPDLPLCIASDGVRTAIMLVDMPPEYLDPAQVQLRGSIAAAGITTVHVTADDPSIRLAYSNRTAIIAAIVSPRAAAPLAAAVAERFRALGDAAWLPSRW